MIKKRYDNLDLMKAIAILLVLMLHTPLFTYDFISNPTWLTKMQYGIRLILEGVPIFVTINGFLLLKKENLDVKKHIQKMLSILLVLIAWAFILTILGMIITNKGPEITIIGLIHNVLKTNISNSYNGVLWFLQSLLGIYLLYPILNYFYVNKYELFKYLFIVVSIFTIGINIIVIGNNVLKTMVNTELLNEAISFINQINPFKLEWFLFYFMFGGIIYKHLDFIKNHRCLLIIVGIFSYILAFLYGYYMSISLNQIFQEWFNSNSVFMVLIITGLFAFTIKYENKGNIFNKFITSVGQNTLGIYLSHFIFLYIAWNHQIITFLDKNIVFISVFLASYLLTIILGRIPLLKKLIIK